MATSLAQLNKQIAKLEKQAQVLKKKEAAGVIARIKEAIAIYDLTAADLGLVGAGAARAVGRGAAKKGVPGKTKSGRFKTGVKFRDDQGNAWSGHGRRPQWYLDAIASGKTPDQLAV